LQNFRRTIYFCKIEIEKYFLKIQLEEAGGEQAAVSQATE
jgi:hypothetical protein